LQNKHSDEAIHFATFASTGTAATLGSQSPKDFNMDNPLQAEGAARGIGESETRCIGINEIATQGNRRQPLHTSYIIHHTSYIN
jgi:hypothetical protein